MEIIYSTILKSRKEHKCMFCCLNIAQGQNYRRSVNKSGGETYTWKNHIYCGELASNLNWYDDYDEGLTTENFITHVQEEYSSVMSEHYNEIYESKDFEYPSFENQLKFLLNHHKIVIS